MSLRIRQVKPAFWSDAKLIRLSPDVRLFYVGVWAISDDAGWFDWDPEQVAVDLHLRRAFVDRAMAALVKTGRVVLHDCGHGEVPHLVEHQRLAAETKRVMTVYRCHIDRCGGVHTPPPLSTDPRDIPPSLTFHTPPPLSTLVSKGQVKVSNGQEAQPLAPAREEAGEVAVLAWLAAAGCHVTPNGNGLHQKIGRMVDQHGAERVVATFEALGTLHEARQYILGADDRLNPLPATGRSKPAAKGLSNAADLGKAVERV